MQKETIKRRPSCPKCQAISTVKNGHNHNKQRYKCKVCNFSFTRMESRGVPSSLKSLAYWLYLSKQSYGQIAQLFNVSAVAVYKWVKAYAQKIGFEEVGDNVKEIQIDEVWHFLGSKKTNSGSGEQWIALRAELSPQLQAVVILKHLGNSGS